MVSPLGKQALPAQACILLYCLCSLESVRRACLHVLLALHPRAQSVQLEWCLSLLFTAAHESTFRLCSSNLLLQTKQHQPYQTQLWLACAG